jgi:hypothetical protein
LESSRLLWTRFVCQRSCLEFRNFPPFKELGDDKRRTDAYFAAEANGQRVALQNGNHEDLDMIWFVAGAALGIVTSHGQARAQAPGCVVMEVAVEDQEAFTQRSPPVVDKLGKENEPRGLGQQEATIP